ncbi:MAG: ester cyclase [Halobacteriales archaeon]
MAVTESDNKALVRQYLNAFNDFDFDAMSELLADDVVEHGAHEELEGIEEIIDFLERYTEVFPDYSGTAEAVIAEDDLITVRFTASGTHTGEYRDIEPTGHACEWTGIAIYRIEDDEIAEIWLEEDRLELLETLEAVQPEVPHHFA